jgi:type VI secretion system protein ImpL
MSRIWMYLTNRTVLGVIGLVVISAFILLSARTLHLAMMWAVALAILLVVVWGIVWFVRRRRAIRAAKAMDTMLQQDSERAVAKAAPAKKTEVEAVRKRLNEAISTLKTSKLGEASGKAALYELPWYVVIGNPAAGKSSAVINSGLRFPFAEKGEAVIQGIGGTRNCDWFFTTEGILLDTAGRYAVHEEDRGEWLGFLHLLKRNRPKAPINGIIIVASVPELTRNRPEFVINLAKQIRERVQEIASQLEVFAPVYVMFTKVDLIAGFVEFFEDSDSSERGRVWGATLPYDADGKADPVAAFDDHFDKIFDGLKEMSIERMALYRGEQLGPGVLTFPVEFSGIRPTLRAFLATLFEENPFQFKPIFRGFYFSSALQEGQAEGVSSERIAERFGLKQLVQARTTVPSAGGFFLRDLFSRVIFSDRNLVRQYSSRGKRRLRMAAFAGSVAMLGLILGTLTWSFIGNQRLVENVQADLDKAIKLQEGRIDLASRMEALEILQDRLEQMEQYRDDAPLALSLGLFQGDRIEAKLRSEYFAGIRQILLKPVTESLESFLSETNRHSADLKPMIGTPQSGAVSADAAKPEAKDEIAATQYKEASPTNVQDAYNALKTYLMLADHQHTEVGHLSDQLTRFWRGWLEANRGVMPREQMIRSAERLMNFSIAHAADADFPTIDVKLVMADQARENLRRVVRGMAARDRVYAEVKARASTRFPAMTVARIVGDEGKDMLAGSYAIPGTFTLDAWEQYVEPAFKEAANKELQTTDWVLQTAARDDLSLEGSPEQIQKALAQTYKTEYVQEWQKFLVGVTVSEFNGFDDAVRRMNLLGDPGRSPLAKVMQTTFRETSWDNPSLVNKGLQDAQRGVIAWFRQVILRQAPSGVNVNVNLSGGGKVEVPMGPIGKEFAGISGLMIARGSSDASLYKGYLETLSKARTRFNQMKTAGDPGPASRQLMQQTLEGSGSELADALKYVDEQMLNGMSDASKAAIRPLLVRPLMMAYAVTIKPTEAELNKTWNAQVYEPFQRILAEKYPFSAHAGVEASAAEIGQILGPDGAIAKYVQTTMGPLVVRRGDTLTARTWADMGIQLQPEFANQFPRYVAPLAGGASTGGGTGGGDSQTVFQIKPRLVSGLSEYTIEIDGQILRYRMGAQEWTNFVWPSPKGQPGARVTAVTYDGRVIEVTNQPGRYGLEKLINSAQRTKKGEGVFELSWGSGGQAVSVDLRIVSSTQAPNNQAEAAGNTAPTRQSLLGLKLPATVAGGL